MGVGLSELDALECWGKSLIKLVVSHFADEVDGW